MNNTIIYLVRHAETVNEDGIRNTNEDSQLINEKEILSVEGEEQAKELSENSELKNIDVIWSSSFARAKATAKYIAKNNNLPINLDSNLSERKLGNLKELGEFMKDKKTRDPSQEQLLDQKFKTTVFVNIPLQNEENNSSIYDGKYTMKTENANYIFYRYE